MALFSCVFINTTLLCFVNIRIHSLCNYFVQTLNHIHLLAWIEVVAPKC